MQMQLKIDNKLVFLVILIFYSMWLFYLFINISVNYPKVIIQSNVKVNPPSNSDIVFNATRVNCSKASSPDSTKKFKDVLREFEWSKVSKSLRNLKNISLEGMDRDVTKILQAMLPFLIKEPSVKINNSCKAPTPVLPLPNDICQMKRVPSKIGVMLLLGFDVDTLEIHLNELGDIVDQFFIVESTRTHFRALRKPLIWELVRDQKRFSIFSENVTSFVLDDSDVAHIRETFLNSESGKNSTWSVERFQERMRWEKFLEWNNASNYFGDEDWLGFGDADEIPSRSAILKLKHCIQEQNPVDIGIWFPFGKINQAYQTDYPIPTHKFTLGDPTYWKLNTAKTYASLTGNYPTRNRGHSPAYLLGGIHMTHYGYLPFQIVKRVTLSEGSGWCVREISNLVQSLVINSDVENVSDRIRDLELLLGQTPPSIMKKVVPLKDLRKINFTRIDEIAILPWFYDCNRQRYPAWEGGHDTRLD